MKVFPILHCILGLILFQTLVEYVICKRHDNHNHDDVVVVGDDKNNDRKLITFNNFEGLTSGARLNLGQAGDRENFTLEKIVEGKACMRQLFLKLDFTIPTWDSNSIEGVEVRQCLLDLYPLLSFPKLSIYNDKETACR